jgi:glyoxylase-like metal-dependent hydrolase (beta-lactamase superfamily II)
MKMLRGRSLHFVLAAALASAAGAAAAQEEDRFKDTKIQTVPVADGIWMLVGEGGNIGVSAGEDGVFLIDDQFAPLTERIKAAIAGISDRPIRFLINTHWHGDHTGGNENLGKEGVVIVAHDNVRKRMSQENFMAAFNMTVPAAPKAALPVITFNDTVTFHLNGQEIRALHQEHAHTDGDSVLHFVQANVIHTGDIWFNGLYPFIDAASGGSVDGVIGAVEALLAVANPETRIIPGHGPVGDEKALEAYLTMLKDARGRVQKLIDAGRTLEEIQAAKPLADYDETWGKGFLKPENFLGVLHGSLTKK